MTPLHKKIVRQIELVGPMTVAEYMARCLYDPQHGYYTTRVPIGAEGDFTTAPEISQMFGELVAVWMIGAWTAAGKPHRMTLAEIGPGRGTLMQDMVRALRQLAPDMLGAADVALIETSPRLTELQRETFAGSVVEPRWHASVDELPHQPLFLVGNEIFDAVPFRQYMKTSAGWRERMVGIDYSRAGGMLRVSMEDGGDTGELCFVAGAGGIDATLLPEDAAARGDGTIFEIAPQRTALMTAIAARIAYDGGAALFFDYGHAEPGFGDTFQALMRHEKVDVFRSPGETDLTSHVDFAALAGAAKAEGLSASIMEQGAFLLAMGIAERAGQLGADKDATVRQQIVDAVNRLCAADQMGTLFKVLAAYPRDLSLPPFAGTV